MNTKKINTGNENVFAVLPNQTPQKDLKQDTRFFFGHAALASIYESIKCIGLIMSPFSKSHLKTGQL